MKNKSKTTKKLELDTEVVADLEASDADTEAVQGGGRGGPITGVLEGRGGISG